jgi:hypothetical protein
MALSGAGVCEIVSMMVKALARPLERRQNRLGKAVEKLRKIVHLTVSWATLSCA